MYPLVKLSKQKQQKFFNVCITIICVLIGIYFVLSAMDLQLNSYIITLNTENVAMDDTKIAVEHINEEGTLYLSDTTSIPDEEVTKYIRTAQGTGTYYIPEGQMTAALTSSDALELGKRFMVLDVVVLVMFVCVLLWKRGNKRISIALAVCYGIATIFTDVVMKYYCVGILNTAFPIQWVVCGRYLVYLVAVIFVYRKFRVSGKSEKGRK